MRWTGTTFLVAAVAISRLPPLNGFASEFLIYLDALGHGIGTEAAVAVPALATVIALALIGGLASTCFAKAFDPSFLGEPPSDHAQHAQQSGPTFLSPMTTAHLADRDQVYRDDYVGIILDTFGDHRRAYQFFVNPLGVQRDSLRLVSGEGEREDGTWDAIWSAASWTPSAASRKR